MKTALIGYGKMGREIERLLRERGHEVVLIVDQAPTVEALRGSGAEVAVEFTMPEAAFGNIATCFEAGVAVVSGTTGWLDRWDEAVELCRRVGGGLFYASNYSIGVNLFFRLSERLAHMMAGFPGYSASMEEVHHIHKKDAPSGTALTLAHDLERASGRTGVEIVSHRQGEVPGTHSVRWRSDVDEIVLTHEAFNRLGLASGAVMAAEFLCGRTGVFSMKDLLPE